MLWWRGLLYMFSSIVPIEVLICSYQLLLKSPSCRNIDSEMKWWHPKSFSYHYFTFFFLKHKTALWKIMVTMLSVIHSSADYQFLNTLRGHTLSEMTGIYPQHCCSSDQNIIHQYLSQILALVKKFPSLIIKVALWIKI